MSARKILIVEDEPVLQLHLKRIVSDIGHEVVGTAATRREAFLAAEAQAPDLVMMDIHLAGGEDGVEVAQALRERFGCAVVFATAYADDETIERATAAMSTGYIVKPFSAPEVRAAITTALGTHARLRSAERKGRSLASALVSMGDAVFLVDERFRIDFANPRVSDLTGWPAQDAADRELFEVLRLPGQAESSIVRETLVRCLEESRADHFPQLELIARDGSRRSIRLDIEPLREGDAAPAGLLVLLREHGSRSEIAVAPQRSGIKRPFGAGTRMIVYSHDTFGLGHLRRCLKIVRALVAKHPQISVLLVTGSPEVHRHEMPPGVDYIKLPSLRKVGVDEYAPRTLAMSSEGIQTLRSELLLRTIRDYEPNVLLVDHAPVGSRGELRSALEWLARRGGCTRILGLRDIIDEPSAVIESWRGGGIYEVLDQLYDHIAVYGARDFFDPIEKYEMPTAVAAKVRFVGYVTDAQSRVDDPYVAVSIGGGDGGGPEVIGTLLEMMRRYRDRIDFRARILTGPFLESELAERFRAEARGLPVEIESFIPSTAALFRGAEVVISTAGYNTTTDILAFARRAVIIPRVLHRQEQLLRARRLEEWGLVRCLAPGEVTPESLFEAIASVRRDGGGALSESRAQQRLPLDGADRFAEFCGGLEVVVQETSSAAVSR